MAVFNEQNTDLGRSSKVQKGSQNFYKEVYNQELKNKVSIKKFLEEKVWVCSTPSIASVVFEFERTICFSTVQIYVQVSWLVINLKGKIYMFKNATSIIYYILLADNFMYFQYMQQCLGTQSLHVLED